MRPATRAERPFTSGLPVQLIKQQQVTVEILINRRLRAFSLSSSRTISAGQTRPARFVHGQCCAIDLAGMVVRKLRFSRMAQPVGSGGFSPVICQ